MSTRIHIATQECLQRCNKSASPLAELSAFSERLRAEPGWTEPEIRDVEVRVLRLLRRVQVERRNRAA